MTGTEVAALPANGDSAQWSESEKALVEAAGLTQGNGPQKRFAPRPVVEAFLLHCRRTGLDPIARQIYCIERGGKWGTQVSIDGARLVAERTNQYRGQTPTQWTADGVAWTDVWLADAPPAAARVGVMRAGFDAPLFATATWKEYAIPNGQMWRKMPALMLGKVAEMLALRKAFPQDLSGLYSSEEMAQAGGETAAQSQRPQEPIVATVESVRDWAAAIAAVSDMEALTALANEAQAAGQWGVTVTVDGEQQTVKDVLFARRDVLQAQPVPLVDVKVTKEKPRYWAAEAIALKDSLSVRALWREAKAAGVTDAVLDELAEIEAKKPAPPKEPPVEGAWAPTVPGDASGWVEPDSAEEAVAAAEVAAADEGRAAVLAEEVAK